MLKSIIGNFKSVIGLSLVFIKKCNWQDVAAYIAENALTSFSLLSGKYIHHCLGFLKAIYIKLNLISVSRQLPDSMNYQTNFYALKLA